MTSESLVFMHATAVLENQKLGHVARPRAFWRELALVPVGCAMLMTVMSLPSGGSVLCVRRELCVFGVRVARWVVAMYPIPSPAAPAKALAA